MQNNNKLHIVIRDVVTTNGTDILISPQFVNILSDYMAFEQYPATKVVMKDVVTGGYIAKIKNHKSTHQPNTIEFAKKLTEEFYKAKQYKLDIVEYVFDSVLYGLQLIQTIQEPESTGIDAKESEGDKLFRNLEIHYRKLKKEYEDALEHLIVRPHDIIWDHEAYYPAKAENQLYLLEGKLNVVCLQLKGRKTEFCTKHKAAKLEEERKKKEDAVNKLLNERKKEYSKLLEKAFVKFSPANLQKLPHFEDKYLVDLNKLEEVIRKLYQQLRLPDAKWCESQKKDIISKESKRVQSTANELLAAKKREYTDLLQKALITPGKTFIKKSGYFDSSYDSQLSSIEQEIDVLYNLLGHKTNNWCSNEKSRILAPHQVSSETRIKQIAYKVVMPSVIGITSLFTGGSYLSSIDSIDQFDNRIQQAASLADKNEYGEAITQCLTAADSYDGIFLPSKYRNEGIREAEEMFEKAQSAVTTSIKEKQYKNALAIIASIPDDFLNRDQKYKDWVAKTKIDMENAVEEDIDALASFIESNDGVLGTYGKMKLEELLAVSPDNYWLNLLKSKE